MFHRRPAQSAGAGDGRRLSCGEHHGSDQAVRSDPEVLRRSDAESQEAVPQLSHPPDGTLLEAGGGTANKIASASYEVSLLTSFDSTWKSLNPIPAGNHRLYHSSHFLLDDGRMVSIGSDPQAQPRSESVLVYSPPYLYKGERPAIVSAPASFSGSAGSRSRPPAALTASPSPERRRRRTAWTPAIGYLSFPISNGTVDMSGALARYMPTGNYRMWAVNAKGAVSKAKWVYLCHPSTEGTECHCC